MKVQTIYSKRPNLVLGFHGCDSSVAQKVIEGGDLIPSTNDYDWLGEGIYFWENNPERALEWAMNSKNVHKPSVLGAILDLGYCMDLMDTEFLKELKQAYGKLKEITELAEGEMPVNKGATPDKLLRRLDCAVIEVAHTINEEFPYDTVRGVFLEGNELYPGASFREKNHIQVCVRNPNCIKGYFLPREVDPAFLIP
ncbi:hypothetical protein FACS189415_4610 [Bacteroidia bacterium]|nr:hypothetical protein FACS189415_4610 [Bacteroidia bacterium]